ncbi:hypothetical protein GGS23DRAFT_11823 [Durotheca rogersii]|uniref:uncharacterized protein n=1 Tax=Durotheca rogersii TaxID=419775 RepID=UPI002220F4A2|nr:uncharacterized protein GGS23DRAFT_11823 [Durotheca rogersii]KAI5868101.1 hypothetical protein GGS23DRAFT_11823 [Durotheca rogersii]
MLGRWAFPSSRKPSAASSGDRASATDNETQAATKRRSRLFRTLRGGFRSHRPKKSAEHVEFPETDALLTQQNPANLTLFNTFEWSGAKRKLSHGGRSNFSGVSPSASRNNSVDYDCLPPPFHAGEAHPAPFRHSAIEKPTQENSRAESDGG